MAPSRTTAKKNAKKIEDEIIGPAGRYLSSVLGLVRMKGRTMVIGDIHGDLHTLNRAIKKFKRGDSEHLLFLGDYIDRGDKSLRTINLLLKLLVKEKGRVHMLRGNHEISWVNEKLGFLQELKAKGLEDLHKTYNDLFTQLPLAAVINGSVFAVHGGVPSYRPSLSVIQRLPRHFPNPDEERDMVLMELLWNDPSYDVEDFGPNLARGRMKVFGPNGFKAFMEKNDLEKMVRAHEKWPKGHKYFFDKRLLSIFSSKSYAPGQKISAAVVEGSSIKAVPL